MNESNSKKKGGVFIYCFKCGRLIDNDSVFCEFCGARFENKQNNNSPYNIPPYEQNNQFQNQPDNNIYRGYNAPPFPNMNMRSNANQSPNNYQVPPAPAPVQNNYNAPVQDFQQQNNEMNEIYHKYMDDQYIAVDSKGNNIVVSPEPNMQTFGNDNSQHEYSRNFKIFTAVISILGIFNCGMGIAELIVGIILNQKGNKKEGNLLINISVIMIILKFFFFFFF